MSAKDVLYLSYITSATNLASILKHGILSHNGVREIPHVSVADEQVQDRRKEVMLPNGRPLHDYANLYFYSRNAMMYRVRVDPRVCILRVKKKVLELDGVYYTSRNAAVGTATFHECGGVMFPVLQKDKLYARGWRDSQTGERDDDLKEIMQAEVLVPQTVPPAYIECVYVRSEEHRETLVKAGHDIDIRVNKNLFFM